jgi:NAD+ synthase (glutamine-hydrolysing)
MPAKAGIQRMDSGWNHAGMTFYRIVRCINTIVHEPVTTTLTVCGLRMSVPFFRIALSQMNSTVGDLRGNVRKIVAGIQQARAAGADLVAFPELAITGYPPEDLLLKPQFIRDNLTALSSVVEQCHGITAVVGFVDRVDRQDALYNSAAILHAGRVGFVYHKQHLPNYGVFDEARYFRAGRETPVFTLHGRTIGVNICEDIWEPCGPTVAQVASGGAGLIVNISASPYHAGKGQDREKLLAARARENGVIVAYVNQVGGQDELVFDGGSLVFDEQGALLARGVSFDEALIIADLNFTPVSRARRGSAHKPAASWVGEGSALPSAGVPTFAFQDTPLMVRRRKRTPFIAERLPQLQEVYCALMLGLLDYVRKNRFKTCGVALSGGIDSALTAAIAADALGKEQVVGVFMPSRYTAPASGEDAKKLADNLGIRLMTFPIEAPFQSHLDLLAAAFSKRSVDATEENLQSRIRGNIMMALSNKFGWLVLTTGNKSELSVGYATLYGDMAGGFALLKDIWKTEVYRLARWRNRQAKAIPVRTLSRAPTAELRANQTDQDTLLPYAILDPILRAYVEEDQDLEAIVAAGFDRKQVSEVMALVDRSEFKRRQAPIGVKITQRALGKDRRMPVTHRYGH